jgi:hypothetical protein
MGMVLGEVIVDKTAIGHVFLTALASLGLSSDLFLLALSVRSV